MTDKFLTLLGFAAKARKLSYGMSATVSAVFSGRSKAVLVCRDISEKSRKEIKFQAAKRNIRVLLLSDYDIITVSDAVGRKCGIISIDDSSFAEAILKASESGRKSDDSKI